MSVKGAASTHRIIQWNVGLLSSGAYKIQNYGHGSFANGENGFLAKRGDGIVGGTHPQQWKIIEMPSIGEYWCVFLSCAYTFVLNNYTCSICPVANVDICWSLVDSESDYPVRIDFSHLFNCIIY